MMGAALYRLWAMSLQASILILIVLAVRFFLGKYPRIYSYCLWILVGIRLLCPIWVESPFSLQPDLSVYSGGRGQMDDSGAQQPEFILPQGQSGTANMDIGSKDGEQQIVPAGTGQSEEILSESKVLIGEERGSEAENLTEQSGFFAGIKEMLESGRAGEAGSAAGEFYRVFGLVYLIGVAGCLFFYFVQYLWMRKRVAAAVRDKGNVWLCDKIVSPFVMGVIFPKIYLPYQISGTEKKYVLRHERIHIKHHDPLIRIIGTLCACLHWWNPLVWLAVYLMNQDMEMFCDETVLRHAPLKERKAYAQILLSFAEKDGGFGAGLAFGESHTERRVKNIMKKRKKSVLVVCLVVVLGIFCVVALMTVPRSESQEEGENSGNREDAESALSPDISSSQNPAPGTTGTDAADAGQGGLSDADLAWLMEVCPGIPDFSLQEEMDAAFWENYFFYTYTSDFDREQVSRFSEQYGFDIPYIRVSFSEAEETVRQLFGRSLGEYGIRPEELGAGGSNLIYEDGFLYIAASDSPAYQFALENVTTTDILTEVSLLKIVERESASRVMLYLLPAENERGFVLDGKEEISAPQVLDKQVLDNQSFEVDMNPYGTVTFAAFAPDISVSPYTDVTFKLLQNGQEIYSFPLQGTGVREDRSVFEEMGAVAFPDLNGDGYTDVVTIANYQQENGTVSPQVRIFTYNQGGYFLEELYLEDAYNFSHEDKTIADVEAFAAQRENQDYFARTSIYGRWQVTGYHLPGVYALSQSEIDGLVGTRLEYGITSLWTNTDGERDPVTGYERETVTIEELEEVYRINGDDLGISEDETVYYQVNAERDSLFGCFFYLIDSEHALIYYEGVFFEAERE